MSLKGFHVVFICAAVLLALGLGFWSLQQPAQTAPDHWTLWAVVSFAVAVALVVYEVWFLRKTRRVSSW